jgi:hypothetical protein
MHTEIWRPGENSDLDSLFETLRHKQHSDTSHVLYENYNKKSFEECAALSITFYNDVPVVAGSILKRDCWPNNVYRILNRFWKIPEHRIKFLDRKNGLDALCQTVKSHTTYALKNLNAELVFMSRQYGNWQKFTQKIIQEKTGINFEYNSNRYLTCSNCQDESCWQFILYHGSENLTQEWLTK